MSSENASQQPSLNPDTVEQTKRQIRGLVSEIAQLSKGGLGPEEYYPAFLQRVVSALAAVGGAVWVVGEGGRLQLAYQIKLSETLLDPESEDAVKHIRLMETALRSKKSHLIPPLSGPGEEAAGANPTHFLLVLSPLQTESQVEGLVEIFQRPDSQPATQRGYLRFLQQMAELAGEWLKSRKLQQFSDRHSLWAQADHFARLVHDSLDVRETAYTITNEGRRLIGCDRVSVAIQRGHKCKVEAVSGQDTLENRSNIVAGLSKLATRVVATGEPLWYDGSTEDLPPQIEQALQAYVDESHSRSITVLPLRKPGPTDQGPAESSAGELGEENVDREVTGALIIEQIETDIPQEVLAPRIDLVYEHSARAISNASDHSGIFLMPVWRALGRAKWVVQARTLPKTLAITAAVVGLIAFLCLYPADFGLRANGSLEPVLKQDIFADVEGVVVQVHFDHGDLVKENEIIAELRNPDLLVRWEQTVGQRDSTRKQFVARQRQLQDIYLSPGERARASGESAALEIQLETLGKELALLEQKIRRLEVRAPIAGRVITWDVKRLLLHRTVMPGQVMMTIADVSDEAEWQLELYMPENRMGHVNRRLMELRGGSESGGDEPLQVSYILATDPGVYRHGVVKDVDPATHLHEEEGHSVRILVAPDEKEIREMRASATMTARATLPADTDPTTASPVEASPGSSVRSASEIADLAGRELRPGASVKAELHCGTRPIGYVWTHEAIEWFQVHILFKIL